MVHIAELLWAGGGPRGIQYNNSGVNNAPFPEPLRVSKIRSSLGRDVDILVVIVFMHVFGADMFPPFRRAAPVRYGRFPGRREDTRVFDREFHL